MANPLLCRCGLRLAVKDEWAGKQVKCRACGERLTVPMPEVAVIEEPPIPVATLMEEEPPRRRPIRERPRPREEEEEEFEDHRLSRLSVGWVILLNTITLGLFVSIWFNLMHGRMPKVRRDDPSAAAGFWFLIIPIFNFYWFFFTYLRLLTRLDEQRTARGLPPMGLHGWFIAFAVIHLVSTIILMFTLPAGIYVNPVTMILGNLLFSIIQCRVNELVDASAFAPVGRADFECPECGEPVRVGAAGCPTCGHELDEANAAWQEESSTLARRLQGVICRNRRVLCLTWGWLTIVIGLGFLAILTPYLLGINLQPDAPELGGRLAGTICFTVPFLMPGVLCLLWARGFRRKMRRLEAVG